MRKIVFAAVAALLSLPAVQGQSLVMVQESKIRATLKNGSTVVSIPAVNPADRPLRAILALDWLNPTDIVLGSARLEATLPSGASTLDVPLPITRSSIWTRLRYNLAPDTSDARAFPAVAGVVSISQIADHVFELNVSHAGLARRGRPVTIQAQAVHPATRKPVAVDKWAARLVVDDVALSPEKISPLGEGMVEFTFEVPAAEEPDPDAEAEVWVQARAGDFVEETAEDMPLPARMTVQVQTDKPIYQPGQTIHFRAIVLDAQDRAAEGAAVKLELTDADSETVHTVQMVSSHFGIVQDDWTLPATASLGTYELSLTTAGDQDYSLATHMVRVSRYDLPTFSVTAKPDRAAYLANQETNVTVSGAYLFGKPVPKGRVRIVRTGEPRWNPKTRRLESKDETLAEGEAGENGMFVAQLDLKDEHNDLKDSESNRFRDVHCVAYYTDPSSGRTEQRRFDVRVTREPIHVYIIRSEDGGPLPAAVYVSTSYADGRPAQATVGLIQDGRTVTVQTNRYGVGKAWMAPSDSRELEARATDASGQTGTWKERYWSRGVARLRLETKRTFFRAGEAVTIQITAPPDGPADQSVVLHATVDNIAVARRVVRIMNRSAEITFQYQPEFRRTVVFTAWSGTDRNVSFGSPTSGERAVLFPDSSDLRISAAPDRAVYKPGEQATLRMQVTSADGKPAEAALGVAVVDQAVLERARTDSEFGHRPWFACAFCRDDNETEIGGVRLNDFYSIKTETPVTPELELVAEVLAARAGSYIWHQSSERLDETPRFAAVETQMAWLGSVLDKHYADTLEFPRDPSALFMALGRSWADARDPWGLAYEPRFSAEHDDFVIELISAGPDKLFNTDDDFTAKRFRRKYFAPVRVLIEQSLKTQDDFPVTVEEFKALLGRNGLLIDSLRDPWGTPYRASVHAMSTAISIQVFSAGPDRVVDTRDDFVVATFEGSYFRKEAAKISAALNNAQSQNASPQNNDEFRVVLRQAGIDVSQYRDPWNRPYRVTSVISSRYSDQIRSTSVRVFGGGPAASRTDVIPVTQHIITYSLRSAGADGVENTYDDFDAARFPVLLKEESAELAASNSSQPIALARGTGAISGIVTDPAGAVVPNAKVVLIDAAQAGYETVTGSDGIYQFVSVPAGVYSLRATALGFHSSEISRVPVAAGKTTSVDIELTLGALTESITVEASALPMQTLAAEVSVANAVPIATPRVREYFPETLLWLPEIITDARGGARSTVTLADSVTTWKLAAIASTLDGRVAETESEFRTFQPFFLDFNPPQLLTEGDQIELPVTIRNYQDRALNAAVTLESNDWFAMRGPSTAQVAVSANSSANVAYAITATKSKGKATQRVIARAGRSQDAIEKSSRVHPDGQEVTQNIGDLVAGHAGFSFGIPPNAIPSGTRGELRLYPNIVSVLLESAVSIMNAPHGCAEQTISAGYANLLAWKFAIAAGAITPRIESTARANVQLAIEGLARFRNFRGGVTYWGSGDPDIAVTAYALGFLVEASTMLPVDLEVTSELTTWLDNQQGQDGQWQAHLRDTQLADKQALLLTGLVVRSLAAAQKAGVQVNASRLSAAYRHIAKLTDQIDEPYMLSQFILAALDSGDEALLGNAVARLVSLAREERGGLYWDLRTNTPFYGWGTAGRFETTGLAVSALAAWRAKHSQEAEINTAIRRGLVFLLRGRDNWGGWSSTQSTVRAMCAIVDARAELGSFGGGGSIEVRMNSRTVTTIAIPGDPKATDPILVDVSTFLISGENQIELTPSAGTQSALMRLSTTHWLPWDQTTARGSPELRLNVQFSRLNMRVGEPVQCSVKAERVGFRGYGMMIADIGLPPAAEVDRASLESVIEDGSIGVSRYEVRPDRIVFYLWPTAGGSSFDFYLTARVPMIAKSTASVLYDYYNPEALAELVPSRWTVGVRE